jgi:hypothetical protein
MAAVLRENTVNGEILIIQELCKQLKYSKQKTKFHTEAAKHGVIAVEALLEKAIAKVGGLTRCNKDGRDFTDGSDAKKGVINFHKGSEYDTIRRCDIGNLKNKRGILRIVIADPLYGKLYYFRVPRSVYVGRKSIYFCFNSTGETKCMKYKSGKITLMWKLWNACRVDTFKELCQ